MKITILVDSPDSWIMPYAEGLVADLNSGTTNACLVTSQNQISFGDCAFFLGCQKLVKPDTLKKNKHNLVVHESALPQGKGWSPLSWQILEGKNDISISLFEAVESVDAGSIYLEDVMHFSGDELVGELRVIQGETTVKLVKKFVNFYPAIIGRNQIGQETFYRRRTPKDSELDINKTIAEQFNLLRIVDNDRYPAFFKRNGVTYKLQISKILDRK